MLEFASVCLHLLALLTFASICLHLLGLLAFARLSFSSVFSSFLTSFSPSFTASLCNLFSCFCLPPSRPAMALCSHTFSYVSMSLLIWSDMIMKHNSALGLSSGTSSSSTKQKIALIKSAMSLSDSFDKNFR